MTAPDLQSIKARAEAATAGPWRTGNLGDKEQSHVVDFGPPPTSPFMLVKPGYGVCHSDGNNATRDADFIAHAREDVPLLIAAIERLTVERDAADAKVQAVQAALQQQHDWHLSSGTIGLKTEDGEYYDIDNAAEYADSGMYERTVAALEGHFEVAARGGMKPDFWAISVLQRRKIKAAETALAEVRAENERLRDGLAFYARPEIYKPHPHGPAFDRRDLSDRARSLLQKSAPTSETASRNAAKIARDYEQ